MSLNDPQLQANWFMKQKNIILVLVKAGTVTTFISQRTEGKIGRGYGSGKFHYVNSKSVVSCVSAGLYNWLFSNPWF